MLLALPFGRVQLRAPGRVASPSSPVFAENLRWREHPHLEKSLLPSVARRWRSLPPSLVARSTASLRQAVGGSKRLPHPPPAARRQYDPRRPVRQGKLHQPAQCAQPRDLARPAPSLHVAAAAESAPRSITPLGQ